MNKYTELHKIFGSAPGYNDKLLNGRSLKWIVTAGVAANIEAIRTQVLAVPYVTGVKSGTSRYCGHYIRVYVKNL
jgi:hypothetical protein